jgi:maleylpyruvate isomerase
MTLLLHGYWRSSAAYRVRIALNLKGLEYGQIAHDLRTGAQRDPAYLVLAPIGLVPTLETDGIWITQSLAIMEWLEESYAGQALLPDGATARSTVRAMAQIVACNIHPLNNLRVLAALRRDLKAGEDMVQTWISRWIGDGFAALEALVSEHGRGFCFGNQPTMADCCLVPQLYNAGRFGVELDAFPTLVDVEATCLTLPAFDSARPDMQPDADQAVA